MKLERVLAVVLAWGTRAAAAVIALGLVLGHVRIIALGVLAIIALPFARVAIMVIAFAHARDVRAALVALLVLVILVTGLVLGIIGPGAER